MFTQCTSEEFKFGKFLVLGDILSTTADELRTLLSASNVALVRSAGLRNSDRNNLAIEVCKACELTYEKLSGSSPVEVLMVDGDAKSLFAKLKLQEFICSPIIGPKELRTLSEKSRSLERVNGILYGIGIIEDNCDSLVQEMGKDEVVEQKFAASLETFARECEGFKTLKEALTNDIRSILRDQW